MKQKINKFNENIQEPKSLSKPIYERNEIETGKVSDLIANYSSHQKESAESCEKFKSLSLSRVDIPVIFRGLQSSLQQKNPIFPDDYKELDIRKVYEEFDRYDSIYKSKNAVQKPSTLNKVEITICLFHFTIEITIMFF